MSGLDTGEGEALVASDEAQTKPFRFKDKADGRRRRREHGESTRRHHRQHHSSRHRSKRSKTSHLGDDPSQFDPSIRNLGNDRAFQESLFDAMGDDEGAQFWEGVYGQPIHNYPNTYVDQETGEMGQMDDEEYAQYVRRKMWEKSREGIEAAREEERRAKAREKTAQEQKRKTEKQEPRPADINDFDFAFDMAIDASLRRGQRRKDYKRWQDLWKDYLQRWEDLQAFAKDSKQDTNLCLRNKIAWPVESGKRKDVNAEEIEKFITNGIEASEKHEDNSNSALTAALKVERIRWHPDKVQQRYGFMQIDDSTMKGVTATFQTFDRMWNELRPSKR
jgi:hypothetical protein